MTSTSFLSSRNPAILLLIASKFYRHDLPFTCPKMCFRRTVYDLMIMISWLLVSWIANSPLAFSFSFFSFHIYIYIFFPSEVRAVEKMGTLFAFLQSPGSSPVLQPFRYDIAYTTSLWHQPTLMTLSDVIQLVPRTCMGQIFPQAIPDSTLTQSWQFSTLNPLCMHRGLRSYWQTKKRRHSVLLPYLCLLTLNCPK